MCSTNFEAVYKIIKKKEKEKVELLLLFFFIETKKLRLMVDI
jgi:hypothetical protein